MLLVAFATAACGSSSPDPAPAIPAGDAASFSCNAPPWSIPMSQDGSAGHLTATVVGAMPEAPAKHNNVWTVEVLDKNRAPVADTEIALAQTSMPVHGHLGDPPPTVELATPATFRLAFDLAMRGKWNVRLDLTSATAGSDEVVFEVCVPE
jgi:hypothetical protein